MTESDLGPKPDAEIEPREPNPGGADAFTHDPGPDGDVEPAPRDLDPDDNPAVEDALPEEMKQTEDTETEATKSDGKDVDPDEESPA